MPHPVIATPDRCDGVPHLAGTPLTIASVVALQSLQRMTPAELVDLYDTLTVDELQAAMRYCARRQCAVDKVPAFCEGCALRPDAPAPPPPSGFTGIKELVGFLQNPGGASRNLPTHPQKIKNDTKYWEHAQRLLDAQQ